MSSGCLFLLPTALGPGNGAALHPPEALAIARRLTHFIVESGKSARAELKRWEHPAPLSSLSIEPIPEQPDTAQIDALLAPAMGGHDLGLMSDAGCPAVADPGAQVVRRAHALGIRVMPVVGPSSLLLALMASGLNGQSFAFHGYLPPREPERSHALHALEDESGRLGRTQLFIETPYRNDAMFAALRDALGGGTLLCVAREVATPGEWIRSLPVEAWRQQPAPELDRRPTVFLLLAPARAAPPPRRALSGSGSRRSR